MRNKRFLIVFLWLAVALCAGAAFGQSTAVLLREGLYAEEIEGDLDAAIEIYQQIIEDSSAQRQHVAQALYRQGMCHLKKKNEQEAQTVFRKLVADYGDQTQIVEKVKPMLEELGNNDPAALMPPETLLYVEIGSPGRQVETILNMLKGTPFENPLAVLNAGQAQEQQSGGQKSSVEMLAGLLNPSMMAEFTRIRGIGVGLTGIAQEDPPLIGVLFFGKSDTLRSVLQLALGVLGRPADPIEGMQVVTLGSGGTVAYDDTVVILASPAANAAGQLQWSIKQHKGLLGKPALASSSRSFAKIGRKARQQNTLTLWVNVDETYQKLLKTLPADKLPKQIQVADELVDLNHVDDLIASLSLRETGVALEANISFREGHQSLAYNMIRTPSLNRDALKVVPSEAVALISLALGGPDTPQAAAVSQQIKTLTGLETGPDLFANVEQITLFALPPGKIAEPAAGSLPAAAGSVGLAITSADPEQTRQLLTTLLRSAKLIPADTEAANPVGGNYQFTLVNNEKLFCHMNQGNKTTVVSLSPETVATAVAAMAGGPSAAKTGPLAETLSTLSPATSKLVAISVAGALRFAAQNMELPSKAPAEQVRESLTQLAQASEKTTFRLQTSEEQDNFGIRLSISDLPPASETIGRVMQIVQTMKETKAQEAERKARAAIPAGVAYTATAPTFRAETDACWAGATPYKIRHIAYSDPSSPEDCSATFKALWDKDNLYVLVDVVDETSTNDSEEFWLDDGVEIFIDADNSKADVYGENDYQYYFAWEGKRRYVAAGSKGEAHHNKIAGVVASFTATDDGYRVGVTFPWETLGLEPSAGARIGLDVHVNDDDDGGDRDSKLMWRGREDIAWEHPSAFGTAELQGLIGWWKLDESEGTEAADSSGNGHGATLQGNPTWHPAGGKIGGALAFDGDGDYLEVADESVFDFTAGVTVSAWINVNTFDKRWQAVIAKGDGAWRLQRYRENSSLEFACSGLHIPGNDPYGSLFGNKEITPGQWHHVVGVYDGKQMSLYLDGALDTSQDAWGPVGTNDEPVLIGENSEQPDRFWDGRIDDVRVYNYGLTEAQVRQLYSEGK